MKVTWRFRCGNQHTIDAKARGEPSAAGLQVNVAGCGVVRVAHQQVHVAYDWRLVSEIPNVGRQVVAVRIRASQLHTSLGARCQSLDQPLELLALDRFVRDWTSIGVGDVQRAVAECVRRRRDDEDPIRGDRLGTEAMVQQVFSSESRGQRGHTHSTLDDLADRIRVHHLTGWLTPRSRSAIRLACRAGWNAMPTRYRRRR
jgi:hypothetical protein